MILAEARPILKTTPGGDGADDWPLVLAARAGDRAAAGELLARHNGLMVQWCEERLRPGVEMDDLLQEARMAGLDAIRWFKPGKATRISSYLKVCVSRRLARYLNPRKPRPTLVQPMDGSDRDEVEALPPVIDRDLLAALQALTKGERTAVGLKWGLDGGGERSVVAVAQRMNVKQRTAAWLIEVGEAKLREAMGPDGCP